MLRSKLRTGKDGGSLVRTRRLTGDLELLRIVLSGTDGLVVCGCWCAEPPNDVRFW